MNAHTSRTFRRTALTTLLALPLLAAAGSSEARPLGPPAQRGGPQVERALESLDLDDETLAAAYAVLDAARADQRALRRDLTVAREALHGLVGSAAPDRAEVMTSIDALAALEARMHKHRVGTMLDVRALLTDDQRAALEEKLGARGPRRGAPEGKADGDASRRRRPAS